MSQTRVRDNLAGTIWQEKIRRDKFVGKPIRRSANLEGKINKNNLPSLALKRQQKSFFMSLRQLIEKAIAIVQLIRVEIRI